MSSHKLTDAALTRAVKHTYITGVWNALALLGGALFLIWKLDSRWTVLFAIGPVLLIGLWNTIRRAEAHFRSYRVDMDETGISRQFSGMKNERIDFSELGSVIEVPGEGILMRSFDGKRRVAVSDGLEGYESIRETVTRHVPIQSAPPRRDVIHLPGAIGWGVGTLIAVVTFLTTVDPLLIVVTGTLLALGLGAFAVYVLRENLRSVRAIATGVVILFLVIAVAARIYMVWIADY